MSICNRFFAFFSRKISSPVFFVMMHCIRFWKSKKHFLTALFPLCAFAAPLAADWSSPPIVIYPSSAPFNATNPSIATDANGNSVAVWFDSTACGSMQGATLASGAVNASGQPLWVLTNPVATSDVQDPFNPYAQAVGMDSFGNATAVWTDGINIFASVLTPGQSTWSTPVIINTPLLSETVTNLYIAVAENGNAVVTWLSSIHPYDFTVLANAFDFSSQLWRGQVNLLGASVEFESGINQVAIDPQGNAVVVMTTTSDSVQALSYNFNTATWTRIPSVASTTIVFAYSSIDSAGNAVVVWIEQNNTVNAATLIFNALAFTDVTVLSVSADTGSSFPLVTTDAAGNAVAVWPDVSGNLASARYSFVSKTWTGLDFLILDGNIPNNISLSGDANGNVVASWTIFVDSTSYIQAAVLAATDSLWSMLTQLSPTSDEDNNSQIVLTTRGNAVALWENDINGGIGTIDSAIFLNLFVTSPFPSFFTGQVILNAFSTQTDRVHQLTWGASESPTITGYRLYRNAMWIASFTAGSPVYFYEDHNRNKKVTDTYMLSSVNANGSENTPLIVTLR